MAKKVQGYIKLQFAGAGAPRTPIAPDRATDTLGQQGVNIMEFCKQFNAQTQKVEKGLPIPVIITVYSDRSFTFVMKTPPAAVLIRKAIGIEKGSTPNTAKVGKISQAARRSGEDEAVADRRGRRSRRPPSAPSSRVAPEAWASTWKSWIMASVKHRSPGREAHPGQAGDPVDEALKLVKESPRPRSSPSPGGRCRKSRHRREQVGPAGARLDGDAARGIGKSVRVAVFTSGGVNQELAKAAGGDIVGLEDLAAKVKAGEINFDVVVASPDAMGVVGQLG